MKNPPGSTTEKACQILDYGLVGSLDRVLLAERGADPEGHSVADPAREGEGAPRVILGLKLPTRRNGIMPADRGKGSICLGSVRHPLPPGPRTTLPPPWTEFLTDACEKITFPQLLLRTVKICI